MKNKKFPFVVALVVLMAALFVSCKKDEALSDSDKSKKVVNNENAGTIEGINISSGEPISMKTNMTTCFIGDTLLFRIKTDLAEQYPFKFKCDALSQINDSMFVVPSLGNAIFAGDRFSQYTSVGSQKVIAYYDLDNETNDIHLSATTELQIVSFERLANFRYNLHISQDLLQFIYVKMSYTDENGNRVEKTIRDDEWELMEIDQIILNPYYSQELNYQKYEFRSTCIVSYHLREGQMDLKKDSYKFSHNISCQPSVRTRNGVNSDYSLYTSIDSGDTNIKKEDVQTYLENLVNNPDKIAFDVDKNGNVTKVEPNK